MANQNAVGGGQPLVAAGGDPPQVVAAAGNLPPNFHIDAYDRKKTRWSRWVERLETAFSIYEVVDPNLRRNLLLHLMGSETYETLSDKISPDNPRTKTFQEIVDTLEQHFNPRPLEISENFRFKCRRQGDKDAPSPDESIDEYIVALRRIAVTCNFGNYLDTALRNQLVFGLKRNDIRGRLLERRNLTLQDARDIAVSMELSQKGGAEIASALSKSEVNAVHDRRGKASDKKPGGKSPSAGKSAGEKHCYRCGDKAHLAKACKHQNTVCSYCNIKGHLERVCMRKASAGKAQAGGSGTKSVKTIDQRSSSPDDVDTIEVTVGEICTLNSNASTAKLWTTLVINGVAVRFEIDTGSPVTIINSQLFRRYFKKCHLRQSSVNLVSYCGTDIHVLGVLDATVDFRGERVNLPLYVVNSSKHPLLGREWLNALNVNWNAILKKPDPVNVIDQVVDSCDTADYLKQIFAKYASVFEDSIGKISAVQAKLHLKPNTQAVFFKARKLPFNMRAVVDKELDRLESEGVLTKVAHSNWATPIVPVKKSDNRVRICGDYKQTVNPHLKVDQHPLPTIDELFASLAGGQKFTKIDLVQAYLQMEVAEEDREMLTLNTHRGLYRPNRLMYGVASAPAIWQRQIEIILQGIEGVSVFLDDIKITGPTDAIHLQRLEEVMRRLSQHGIRVNRKKCEFFTDSIEYCGYVVDREGIHKVQQKVDAIVNMPRPKNKDEVRSLVGLVNYYGRFYENLSTVLYPLNNLLKNDVEFIWTKDCEKSFRTVKERMQKDNCLVHYSPDLPLILATDASPYGVGAVLSHVFPDGTERPIQFASQTLNHTQQRYMQVDKEAYAIVFGVRKFFQYLYGRKFVLLTDNQAISKIFSENKGLPVMSALRMQHYATYLQSFDYVIRFRKSSDHANADALSRMPLRHKDPENVIEESDAVEINQIDTLPLTAAELAEATAVDKSVSTLIQGLKHGQNVDGKHRFGIDQSEFSLQKGCLLRGIRVYVPAALRERVLAELHSTHFGTSRTKSLARGYCWWNGMDNDIEKMIANCADCQSVRPMPAKVQPHFWEPATEPFQRVHADFAGPFMDCYFFIMVDAYTKWPEIRVCRSITAESTESMCRDIFSSFGIPTVFVSDHGVQFTAESFQSFLKLNGIVHKMGAPYHPSTNGQAERYVQTFKQKLKALKCPKSQLNVELSNILLTYRKMIHPATGKSPSMMMFGRQIRSRLDLMQPKATEESPATSTVRELKIGVRVRVRDFLSSHKWQFGRVTSRLGSLRYAVKLDDGRIWERHIDHIVVVGEELESPRSNSTTVYEPHRVEPQSSTATSSTVPMTTAPSSEDRNTTGEHPVVPGPTDSRSDEHPQSANQPAQPEASQSTAPPIQERNEVNQPIRRSTRTVKAPQRLNL